MRKGINKLSKQGHIEKHNECLDDSFVSLIAITSKNHGSVKLAVESREIIRQVHESMYQTSDTGKF